MRAKQEGRAPNRRLIPVLYQDCEKPAFLKSMVHVSISDSTYEDGFQILVKGIRGESGKPPLKEEGPSTSVATPPSLSLTSPLSPGVVPKKLVLNLLKSLLRPQFEEVIFLYEVDPSILPTDTQAQKAITLINFAKQKEGDSLAELLDTIYQVAPHLKR